MAIGQMNRIIERIRQMVLVQDAAGFTNAQLLERFIVRQEPAAFEALVRRHGSMVLSVCRRVLRNTHDAEDAFQATFLVLARKAATIRSRELVANWLYGVAYQTALKARITVAKRLAREKPMNEVPEPEAVPQEGSPDWLPLLDRELNSLPEKYRVPILLCDLEGKARKVAAQQLGVPEGTLNSRLARARILLARRLARQGITISGGAIAAILSQNAASAGVPASLIGSTVKAALAIAAGKAVATTLVSAKVAALMEGVLKTMLLTKIKIIIAALLLAMVSFGAVVKMTQVPAAEPIVTENLTRQATTKQEQPPFSPTWKIGPTLKEHGGQVRCVAFSPDGKWLASASRDKTVIVWNVAKWKPLQTLNCDGEVSAVAFAPVGKTLATGIATDNDEYSIKFWDPETGKEQAVLKESTNPIHSLTFSRDGKMLVSTSCPVNMNNAAGGGRGEVCFWDVGTKKKIATLKADLVHNAALSSDRKKLVTTGSSVDGTVKFLQIEKNFAATAETVLVQDQVCCVAFSPDGKTFATAPVSGKEPSAVSLWDYENGGLLKTFEPNNGSIRCLAFAPDGKTLVTGCWRTLKTGDGAELAGEVKFWDVTTGKAKQRLREKLTPVTSLAFSPDGQGLAVGLLHKDNVKLKKGGGFELPAENHHGVVVLYELKKGKN